MKTTYARLGSVSSGTMKPEDLIPAFLDALAECASLADTIRTPEQERIGEMCAGIEEYESAEYWDSDQAIHDLQELEDELGNFAAPYCYFGAAEGNGADYGFWISWESVEYAIETGELVTVAAGLEWSPVVWREHYQLAADCPLAILADRLEEDGTPCDDFDRDTVAAIIRALADGAEGVLESNDHGNATLYTPEGEEVWSCV